MDVCDVCRALCWFRAIALGASILVLETGVLYLIILRVCFVMSIGILSGVFESRETSVGRKYHRSGTYPVPSRTRSAHM